MPDIIETIVIPEVPRVLDGQEVYVYVSEYNPDYTNWGFNLVNGENNYVVYQRGANNNVETATGATVVLGGNNTITNSASNVIIIGDNNISNNDGNKMYGIGLIADSSYRAYYGRFNATPNRYSGIIIGAGNDSAIRFNALEAGIAQNDTPFVQIGNVNADVLLPVNDGWLNPTLSMRDIKNAFVVRGQNAGYYLYGRSVNNGVGYENHYPLASNAAADNVAVRDGAGRIKVHVAYDGYDDYSELSPAHIADNDDSLLVPNMAYLESRYVQRGDFMPTTKTITIALSQIAGSGNDAYTTAQYIRFVPTQEQAAVLANEDNQVIKLDLTLLGNAAPASYIWVKRNTKATVNNLVAHQFSCGGEQFWYDNYVTDIAIKNIGNGALVYVPQLILDPSLTPYGVADITLLNISVPTLYSSIQAAKDNVKANPAGAASGDITKLKVGDTVYNIPSGGAMYAHFIYMGVLDNLDNTTKYFSLNTTSSSSTPLTIQTLADNYMLYYSKPIYGSDYKMYCAYDILPLGVIFIPYDGDAAHNIEGTITYFRDTITEI